MVGSGWSDLIELVVSSSDLSSDPEVRLLVIINALAARLNSPVGVLCLASQPNGPGSVVILQLMDFGVWSRRERSVRDAYMHSPDHQTDPFLASYCRQDLLAGPIAARRNDLVSDEDWYGSDHYQSFRREANQDAAIYITVPARPNRNSEIPNNHLWTLCLCRRVNEPQFSAEERDFAKEFFVGLKPILSEVWSRKLNSEPLALDELPFRLRRVSVLLMAGHTEKQVADALSLSLHTVHGYVKELYAQFGVRSRAQLILRLLEHTK